MIGIQLSNAYYEFLQAKEDPSHGNLLVTGLDAPDFVLITKPSLLVMAARLIGTTCIPDCDAQ